MLIPNQLLTPQPTRPQRKTLSAVRAGSGFWLGREVPVLPLGAGVLPAGQTGERGSGRSVHLPDQKPRVVPSRPAKTRLQDLPHRLGR